MKRLVLVPLFALLAQACLFGGGGAQRTLLVDFSHEDFASFFVYNFPEQVSVHPGTKLVFRQTWTGEPHTVTGGSLVNEGLVDALLWEDFFGAFEALAGSGADLPDPDNPGDTTVADFAAAVREAEDAEARDALIESYEALREAGSALPDLDDPGDATFSELVDLVDEESEASFGGLPWALDEGDDGDVLITQNAGQPCYLSSGGPPEDSDEACSDADQDQPVFDGSHSYYNSGIIPYEGAQGNTFEVQLSPELEPGTYSFYCAVHGPGQRTEVKVVGTDIEVPSQDEVTRTARQQIQAKAAPFEELWERATTQGTIELDGEEVRGPFAGLSHPSDWHVAVNEFVPRQMTVEAGEEITWKMMGADHSISFDVPEYFPIMEFADDGAVRLNPRLRSPAGGAPEVPEEYEGEGIHQIDGGTYDGEGFWSSGLLYGDPYLEYTLRISEPGRYRYACLLHPPMVGTIEVTA